MYSQEDMVWSGILLTSSGYDSFFSTDTISDTSLSQKHEQSQIGLKNPLLTVEK